MKITIITIAIILALGCKERQIAIVTGKEGQEMPNVNLLLMDSTTQLNTINIPTTKPIVIFLFSPYCPYCKAQTKEIIERQASLLGIQFYMVSAFPFNTIKEYYNTFHLDKYPNIIVAQDQQNIWVKYLKPRGFPYQVIYSSNKKLQSAFLGILKFDELMDFAFK